MHRNEAIKLIEEHISLLNLYNMNLTMLIAGLEKGIDITPPG